MVECRPAVTQLGGRLHRRPGFVLGPGVDFREPVRHCVPGGKQSGLDPSCVARDRHADHCHHVGYRLHRQRVATARPSRASNGGRAGVHRYRLEPRDDLVGCASGPPKLHDASGVVVGVRHHLGRETALAVDTWRPLSAAVEGPTSVWRMIESTGRRHGRIEVRRVKNGAEVAHSERHVQVSANSGGNRRSNTPAMAATSATIVTATTNSRIRHTRVGDRDRIGLGEHARHHGDRTSSSAAPTRASFTVTVLPPLVPPPRGQPPVD